MLQLQQVFLIFICYNFFVKKVVGEKMKIVKRDGRIVDYDRTKIKIAIQKANEEVEAKEQASDRQIENIIK